MDKNSTGKLGEMAAANFLRKAGYDIVDANYRSRFGEIDIIACDEKYIVFAEVKTRTQGSMLLPREAVNKGKQEKIIRTAEYYLSEHPADFQPRFDVIEVMIRRSDEFAVSGIHHIKNAFTL